MPVTDASVRLEASVISNAGREFLDKKFGQEEVTNVSVIHLAVYTGMGAIHSKNEGVEMERNKLYIIRWKRKRRGEEERRRREGKRKRPQMINQMANVHH